MMIGFFCLLVVVVIGSWAQDSQSAWFEAAIQGDVAKLKRLHEEDQTLLNKVPKSGKTALYEACSNDRFDAAELLLNWGADLTETDKVSTLSPLDIAAKNGNLKIVKLLLERGADPNEEALKDGLRALHRVAQESGSRHVDVMKLLLQSKLVSPNDKGRDGMTPLLHVLRAVRGTQFQQAQKLSSATKAVKRDMVRVLLEHGTDVKDELTDDDIMQLGLSFREVDEANKKPIAKGMPPKQRKSMSPEQGLVESIQRGDLVWAEHEIVDNKANVNAKQSNGQPAFMTACLRGDLEMAKLLIKHGADPNLSEGSGFTPVHGAGYQGHANIAKYLHEELKMDLNQMHSDGFRPIHRACWGKSTRHPEFVRYVLSAGIVDVDSKTKDGLTPLQVVASSNSFKNPETAKVLVEFGADVSQLSEEDIETLELVSADDFQTCPKLT